MRAPERGSRQLCRCYLGTNMPCISRLHYTDRYKIELRLDRRGGDVLYAFRLRVHLPIPSATSKEDASSRLGPVSPTGDLSPQVQPNQGNSHESILDDAKQAIIHNTCVPADSSWISHSLEIRGRGTHDSFQSSPASACSIPLSAQSPSSPSATPRKSTYLNQDPALAIHIREWWISAHKHP